MKEFDIKEGDYNLPFKIWVKIIALSVILLGLILGMFGLIKWHL